MQPEPITPGCSYLPDPDKRADLLYDQKQANLADVVKHQTTATAQCRSRPANILFELKREKKKIKLVIQLKLLKTAKHLFFFFQNLNAKLRFIMFGLWLCSLFLFFASSANVLFQPCYFYSDVFWGLS